MRHITLNFPDEFLVELKEYCSWHGMKQNAVLMRAFHLMTAPQDVGSGPAGQPSREGLIDSGRLELPPQPGERVMVLDDGRKR